MNELILHCDIVSPLKEPVEAPRTVTPPRHQKYEKVEESNGSFQKIDSLIVFSVIKYGGVDIARVR